MSDDIEKINEIFRIHDEQISSTDARTSGVDSAPPPVTDTKKERKNLTKEAPMKKVDRFLTDSDGRRQHNYTGDE